MSFVEMRTYQLKTGTANTYAALYLEEGFAIQKSHLGEPVGYYVSEVGDLNQVIQRTALFSDPAWLEYVSKIGPMVVTQRNAILNDILN